MPSADQVPVKTSHSTMLWPMWVVLITGSTGLHYMLSALSNHYITSLPARFLRSRFALSSQCDGFLVTLTSGHHRPGHAGKFVGECNRGHLGRSPFEQLGKPQSMLAAMDFCVSDHRQCTSEEERAQVSIALLCDIAKLLPTAARMLLRHQSDPGRE